MTSNTRKVGFGFVVIVILCVVAWFAVLRSPTIEPPPLPDPNGYDDFVRAGDLLLMPASDWADVDSTGLREMVAGQAQALSVMRQGLSKECRVPMRYEVGESAEWLPGLAAMKSLTQALCAESRLAQEEQRIEDATRSCMDIFRLGGAASSGGVLIHALVRAATDALAETRLRALTRDFSAEEAREVSKQLEQILDEREPLPVLLKREAEWSGQVITLTYRLTEAFRAKSLQPVRRMNQRAEKKCLQNDMRVTQLLLNIASCAYELEKGHPPESTSDLVPEYLKTVPADPVTGDPAELAP